MRHYSFQKKKFKSLYPNATLSTPRLVMYKNCCLTIFSKILMCIGSGSARLCYFCASRIRILPPFRQHYAIN